MLALRVVACAPDSKRVRLPKRVERARRVVESKRIENFKKIHEELKRAAKEEHEALKEFFQTFRGTTEETEEAEPSETAVDREE